MAPRSASCIRHRFTVRRLMVAVVIVGIVLGVTIERRNRFRRLAARHRAEFEVLWRQTNPFTTTNLIWNRVERSESLIRKYERAARYPWLPIGPDRPDPK